MFMSKNRKKVKGGEEEGGAASAGDSLRESDPVWEEREVER